ncbi:hypothetical protein [Microbacterium sp.]|uniref:hypothetical protein n=1 Tax=Microbacterium sp. TaxID=51671 RepID=UPI003A93BCC0
MNEQGRAVATRSTIVVSIVGILAVVAYAVWGAVQVMILTPMVAVPGLTIREIRAAMSAAGESPSDVAIWIFVGLGVALAVMVALIAIRSGIQPELTALLFLGVLTFGAPALFIASFGWGMALADTFGVSGGITAPGMAVVYLVSALAGAGSIVLGVIFVMRSRHVAVTI